MAMENSLTPTIWCPMKEDLLMESRTDKEKRLFKMQNTKAVSGTESKAEEAFILGTKET